MQDSAMLRGITGRWSKTCILIAVLLLDVVDPNDRKVDNNVSIGPPDPQAIWPVTDQLHNNTAYPINKNLYGVYYDVTFASPGPEAGLAQLQFDAAKKSHMIFFNDGPLDGFHAVTWAFYVYPSFAQKAVLMQYEGDGKYPGMQLLLETDSTITLHVWECSVDNCEMRKFPSVKVKAPADKWTLLVITWNKLWPDPEFDFIGSGKEDQLTITDVMEHMRLTGNVHFGASPDGKDYFTGGLSCFQFYNTSIIGKTQGDIPDLCDPKKYAYPEYGDPIASIEFFNMMTPTTVEATTEGTTTEQATTQITEVTTTETRTTYFMDMTPINDPTTPSEMASLRAVNYTTSSSVTSQTTGGPPSTPPVPVVDFPGPDTTVPAEERIQDCCAKFFLVGKQLRLSAPSVTTSAGSWSVCTRLCLTDVTCKGASLDTGSGMCSIGDNTDTVYHETSSTYEKSVDTNC